MSVSTLRTHVLAVKERLAAGREKIEARHRKGSPGIQVCWALSDLLDTLVLELFETALSDLGQDGPDGLRGQVALVPHGGYGRRDVAPYSDVDLMILHTSAARSQVAPLAERMVRDLFDAGMNLAQSVRTPAEACRLARKDATICTSLVEARYLAGSVKVYRKFASTFQKQARRHGWSLLRGLEKARLDERVQYGETVYLLEPNVKRSPGGLRDIQLLRWIGFVRYETPEPDGLRLRGVLSREDYEAVRLALEFLLRLRNEMHFHARKSSDVLDRVEQVRLAELFGYQGSEGLLPVEQFMRDYFRLTNDVSNLVSRFQKSARRRSRLVEWLAMIFSHQFEQDFRVGPTHITANQRGLAKLRGNLAEILRLADYANHDDKVIAHETREAIRAAVPELDDTLSAEAQKRFLSLLSRPARLGELLRDLHSMGVLEKVIPAFRHARCLLQFNEYHKYTVDEHCLRAVEQAAEFQRDTGPVGWVYRHIKRKWLLHLALLLHDLGKGHAEDHSEVGRRIADDTARRLGLVERDAETLRFLVHKHLLMSYLAFRRDTSDEALVVRFAVEVGSPETLQMLFVLTAADLAAVGPGVLNAWKVEVLADLHRRAMQHLAGEAPAVSPREHLQSLRDEVLPLVPEEGRSWFKTQLAALPVSYLRASRPGQVAEDLIRLRRLSRGDAIALGRFQPET
ncbi:MAG: HD domain-containing protein, partial [Pirellulales bacterium]